MFRCSACLKQACVGLVGKNKPKRGHECLAVSCRCLQGPKQKQCNVVQTEGDNRFLCAYVKVNFAVTVCSRRWTSSRTLAASARKSLLL